MASMEDQRLHKHDPEALVSKMRLSRSTSKQSVSPETDFERFDKSFRELKDLRSQLHHAADYCQDSFLKTTAKKKVVENTKSYLCQAIITVIDHLGTVSCNLEDKLQFSVELSQTEQKIDFLKQRLNTCQQYAVALDISMFRMSTKLLRHHPRYLSPFTPPFRMVENVSRVDFAKLEENGVKRHDDQLAVVNTSVTCDPKLKVKTINIHLDPIPGLIDNVPAVRSPRILSKPWNPLFISSAEEFHMIIDDERKKKSTQGNNFLAFLKRSKRRV